MLKYFAAVSIITIILQFPITVRANLLTDSDLKIANDIIARTEKNIKSIGESESSKSVIGTSTDTCLIDLAQKQHEALTLFEFAADLVDISKSMKNREDEIYVNANLNANSGAFLASDIRIAEQTEAMEAYCKDDALGKIYIDKFKVDLSDMYDFLTKNIHEKTMSDRISKGK